MANMAEVKPKPKFAPPEGTTTEFMIGELWSDMKEIKEFLFVGNGHPSLKSRIEKIEGAAVVFGIVAAIYCLTHIQEVVASFGKWIGIQ